MAGTNTSTADILGRALEDLEPIEERRNHFTNFTSNSCSYSSSLDSSRSHLRLKMSGNAAKLGLGPTTMKIPSLLQKLPCHGSSNNTYSGTSPASAVTFSALNVLERGSEEHQLGGNFGQSKLAPVSLDDIDLDNITISDLQGLQAGDGDTLKAKHLNKLSRKEREHVLQDIHGVADVKGEEAANIPVVNDLLKKFQVEVDAELGIRKANKNMRKDANGERNAAGKDGPESLQQELGKLQEKLDKLVRQRNSLDSTINGAGDFSSRKQLSAKNHALFGKLGDMGGFGSFSFGSNSSSNNKMKNNFRPSAVPSSCFGGSSSFFSPTTAIAFASNTNEAQQDATILKSKDSMAYEKALAQCRGRRRERNNSLFRPNLAEEDDSDDLDEGLYIDVEQREFRLSFLRAERFDTKKAATRMIDYFEEKRRLFGVDKLTSKIQLKDLDAESKYCLESGQLQLLPGRDRAGRAVIVETKKLAVNKDRHHNQNSILRALWVLSSIALEDIETEKNGVVFVKYDIGGALDRSNDALRRRMSEWGNILKALPLRITSMHWCVQNKVLQEAASLSALMLGGSIFVRVRCYAGSDMDVQYNLMSSGIPTTLFPVSMDGLVDLASHRDFLQQRKKMEASTLLSKALALVEAPMFEDCTGLDVGDSGHHLDAVTGSKRDRFPTAPMVSSGSMHTMHQKQSDYQQQDNGYNNNNNNNMNKMQSPAFNDPFGFVGNRNPMQVQTSMQQHFEQRRQQQQMLNDFQQQHLGMNMGMGMGVGMGMAQQFPQGQQKQDTGMDGNSKSGISYSMEPVLVPGELDILLGRGRGAQNHKGNIHYRQVVETFRSRYEQIPQKGAKTQLIREVVAVIYDNGGRFLKQDGFGRWIPVDPEVARDKVSHSFRNQKRLSTGAIGSNTESSSSKKRSRDEAI